MYLNIQVKVVDIFQYRVDITMRFTMQLLFSFCWKFQSTYPTFAGFITCVCSSHVTVMCCMRSECLSTIFALQNILYKMV